jgi:hypothetical protein
MVGGQCITGSITEVVNYFPVEIILMVGHFLQLTVLSHQMPTLDQGFWKSQTDIVIISKHIISILDNDTISIKDTPSSHYIVVYHASS